MHTLDNLHRLLEAADESDNCQYGTLSTGFVRNLICPVIVALEEAAKYRVTPVAWLELGEDELGRPEPVACHLTEPDIGAHRKVPLSTLPKYPGEKG